MHVALYEWSGHFNPKQSSHSVHPDIYIAGQCHWDGKTHFSVTRCINSYRGVATEKRKKLWPLDQQNARASLHFPLDEVISIIHLPKKQKKFNLITIIISRNAVSLYSLDILALCTRFPSSSLSFLETSPSTFT